MIDTRVQAWFKCVIHKHNFDIINQSGVFELPKRTIRCNVKIYDNFKPNNLRDVISFHQDRSSIDMILNELKLLTSPCWNEKYQPLYIDLTKEKYTRRYRLGLNSIFIPDSSPFREF